MGEPEEEATCEEEARQGRDLASRGKGSSDGGRPRSSSESDSAPLHAIAEGGGGRACVGAWVPVPPSTSFTVGGTPASAWRCRKNASGHRPVPEVSGSRSSRLGRTAA